MLHAGSARTPVHGALGALWSGEGASRVTQWLNSYFPVGFSCLPSNSPVRINSQMTMHRMAGHVLMHDLVRANRLWGPQPTLLLIYIQTVASISTNFSTTHCALTANASNCITLYSSLTLEELTSVLHCCVHQIATAHLASIRALTASQS